MGSRTITHLKQRGTKNISDPDTGFQAGQKKAVQTDDNPTAKKQSNIF